MDLGKWLSEQEQVYFSLRLKKNEYVELEEYIWFQLKDLNLSPGTALFYRGVRVTKTKGFAGFNLAAKYRRNYCQQSAKEPWYILTNLESLSAATKAYSKRMGIEEMFRDFKLGGYNLEITQVTGDRLIALILLISLDERLRNQIHADPNLSGAGIEKVDIAVAMRVIKEAVESGQKDNLRNRVRAVLSQSDRLREWKQSMPEGEYQAQAKAYIMNKFEQASQIRENIRAEREKDFDLAR